QALTAVALIFALFLTNPAPICVLDEVDAPLDDANVERFCDLLDRMTRETDTRYLIVTHNAVTMSRMHRLYGVTMIEKGVSRLVSVGLGGAEPLLPAECRRASSPRPRRAGRGLRVGGTGLQQLAHQAQRPRSHRPRRAQARMGAACAPRQCGQL